jgi:hypothetical protein
MSYSYKSIIDGGADSENIYYNATIINNQQRDNENVTYPIVSFNESRDAPIIRDASLYNFSIVRFSMNGPNKTLPLFIPLIQTNGFLYPNQSDPNRTIYYVSVPYQRTWNVTNTLGAAQQITFTVAPESVPVIYRPEITNIQIAPVPTAPALGFTKQDLSTLYYYVYTYKHFVTLVNEALRSAMELTYSNFALQWAANVNIDQAVSPFPYANFNAFLLDHDLPYMVYEEETLLFSIYGDTRAFNVAGQLNGTTDTVTGYPTGTNAPFPTVVYPPYVAPDVGLPATDPYLRVFFNSNLQGLFSNFKNTFFNAVSGSKLLFPLSGTTQVTIPTEVVTFTGTAYTYEILFQNQNYENILNHNPTFNLPTSIFPALPARNQTTYWFSQQDYNSTNSLWSPCSAIVFTSILLPIKKEFVGKPLLLGDKNIGGSSNSGSAFEPIITDFVIDQQIENAEGWRDFTLYEPTAEYRMASLTASHDEIRNIDIQVFWKYRLTGELIPLRMFNCSDVNIKMLFRKISYS